VHGARKQPINARAESVFGSRYWGAAIRARRCLIPANSWDEWHRAETGTKSRWRIRPRIDAPLFSLGGLYMTHGH